MRITYERVKFDRSVQWHSDDQDLAVLTHNAKADLEAIRMMPVETTMKVQVQWCV